MIQHLCLCEKLRPLSLLYAVSYPSLQADFRCRGLPECFEFRKLFFGQSPLHETNGVNVAKRCFLMPVMDGRDKRDEPPDPPLHLKDSQARDVLEV